jgi:hypothetical protein
MSIVTFNISSSFASSLLQHIDSALMGCPRFFD